MNEKPIEWMTDCGESAGHMIGRTISLVLAVISLLITISGYPIMLIPLIVFGVLFALLQMSARVEYEFCYFSDDVEVSAIYNRARRKKKMSFSLSEVEYIVKRVEKQEVTRYYCRKSDISNLYTLVVNKDNKRTALVMEVVPEFLKVLQMKGKVR